jgi:dTDP-4-dehydrorhamnose reductase
MRILITGAAGMLGSALCPTLVKNKHKILATDIKIEKGIKKLDVRNFMQINNLIKDFKPQMIFHLAAETSLEKCEKDKTHAYLTNTIGTQNVALICQKFDMPMVYIGTAGVFDGKKNGFYNEFDEPNPINTYGKTKLEGEKIVEKLLSKYFIVRAGWMIGGGDKDKKFTLKIIKQLDAGIKSLHAVKDKWGTPTYANDFSICVSELIKTEYYGLYHMACKGKGTRYDVAKEILRILDRDDIKVIPVTSNYFAKTYFAPRPRSEMLENLMLELRGMNKMRPWQESLKDYLKSNFPNRFRSK